MLDKLELVTSIKKLINIIEELKENTGLYALNIQPLDNKIELQCKLDNIERMAFMYNVPLDTELDPFYDYKSISFNLGDIKLFGLADITQDDIDSTDKGYTVPEVVEAKLDTVSNSKEKGVNINE